MNTSSVYTTNVYKATVISMCFLILALFIAQTVHSAGAPADSTPSPGELRRKATVHFNSGESLIQKKDYKGATKAFKKAVWIDRKYAEAYSNLGYSYRKQNLYGKAVKAYRKAIKLNPKLAQAHEYLGEAYAEMGDFEKAEKELKVLRDLGSDEASKLEKFIADIKSGKQTDAKW